MKKNETVVPDPNDIETGIVPVSNNTQVILPDVAQFVQLVEKRSALVDAAMPIAIKSTIKSDWCDLGGNPYPKDEAIEKIRLRFGISASRPSFEKDESKDEKGIRYMWTCYMDFSLPGSTEVLSCIGTASNRKAFYAKAHGTWRKQYEIHEDNIKKHAWTNCMHNGITRILGLRGITWDQVEQHVKFTRKEVDRVDYDKSQDETQSRGTTKAKSKTKTKSKSKGEKKDYCSAKRVTDILTEWFLVTDYLMSIGASEEEIYIGYLKFPKPDASGNAHATSDTVQKYKTKRAIDWVEKAIKEIKSVEDMSGYGEYVEAVQDEDKGE